MENYNNDKNTYITRMNKTALSKFDVLKPYLKKKTRVLDYGSGISPEFIKKYSTNRCEILCLWYFTYSTKWIS